MKTTLQALFRSTITGVVGYKVLEALLYLLLARVIWSSHTDLSGSGPHKFIALSCDPKFSRWAADWEARWALSLTLRLANCASLLSTFSSATIPVVLVSTLQSFLPCSDSIT